MAARRATQPVNTQPRAEQPPPRGATARLPELTAEELDVLGEALLHLLMLLDDDVHPSCIACQAARHLGVPACDAHRGDVPIIAERVACARSLVTAIAEARYSLR